VEIKKLFHFLQNKIYYMEGKIMKLKRWDTEKVIFELECSSWEELL